MIIARQAFGRSGQMSTRTIFGAAALGNVTQDQADRTLEVLLDHDVNHTDVAASYGDAEPRIAPWLARERDHFSLATKTTLRTAEEARDEVHRLAPGAACGGANNQGYRAAALAGPRAHCQHLI